jgi:PKD repeat protein
MKKLSTLLCIAILFCHAPAFAQTTTLIIQPSVICEGNNAILIVTPPLGLPAGVTVVDYIYYLNDTSNSGGVDSVVTLNLAVPHIYAPGVYFPQVKARLSDGNTIMSNSSTLTVYHKPIASFTLASAREQCFKGNSFCFTNNSMQNPLQPSNPLSHAIWEYGDAFEDSIHTSESIRCHNYSFSGSFLVALRIIDNKGCRNDVFIPDTQLLIVKPNTQPSFTWNGSPKCFGSSYHFTNTTVVNPGSIQRYEWNFGDNSSFIANAPFSSTQLKHFDSITHVYTASGSFSPSLIIQDSTGCSDTIIYTQNNTIPLPTNLYYEANITASSNPNMLPEMNHFCAGSGSSTVYFNQDIIEPAFGSFEWNFGDPGTLSNIDYNSFSPSHTYTTPGMYVVSFTIANLHPSCDTVFTDTIYIQGPLAQIENIPAGAIISPNQKYQAGTSDTVDFVNNSIYYNAQHVKGIWDFDDDFAPLCTAYSVPKVGATLPFYSAIEQYQNSDHYYVLNGNTTAGKMNCRWSNDSLPRHLYTSWDTVYSWYVNGKTFPAQWGIANIPANSPLTISTLKPVPDPFWQAKGKLLTLTTGTLNSADDSIQYTIPGYGTFKRYGTQTLPNSTLTFHEYVFRYVVTDCYNVKLTLTDSLNMNSGSIESCKSVAAVAISHGKPDAHGLGVSGKICSGFQPNGVIFTLGATGNNAGTLPGCGQTFVLFNVDSLADRFDNTPCDIDGFTNYMGGPTPGGFYRPWFHSGYNYNPTTAWQDASRSSFIYHYGLNAGTSPAPADTFGGYVTVGLVIGSGCANPPFCTEPVLISDTVWYHNILRFGSTDSRFTFPNQNSLHGTNEEIIFTPETFTPWADNQDSVKYDLWNWGDGTATVDSFWYAGDDITDGYYHHGFRRVRYTFDISTGNNILTDSLVFPEGLPRTPGNFSTIPYQLFDKCANSPSLNPLYSIKDSALMSKPIKHIYTKTSEEMSAEGEPLNTQIIRLVNTNAGCVGAFSFNITIGVIDSLKVLNKYGESDSVFCENEPVYFKNWIRYFRFDNQRTELPFNPGRSKDVVYLDFPESTYQYDTINFWANHANDLREIVNIVLNQETGKQDTFYTERLYWNFGDGSPIHQGLNPIHKYSTYGRYEVKMVSRDSTGHLDTTLTYVNISAPVAKIGVVNPVVGCGSFGDFIDSSFVQSSGVDSIKSNFWWFGEGHDSTYWQSKDNLTPKWPYKSNGLFRIKLVIETFHGCLDTAYNTIRVRGPRPKFELISDSIVCSPKKVRVINTSDMGPKYLPNDTPTLASYIDWGDGFSPQSISTRHGDTLEHTYDTPGKYYINMYGSDALPGQIPICDLAVYPDSTLGFPTVPVYVRSIGKIDGTDTVGVTDTWDYSVPFEAGSTYSWSVEGGTIQSGAGTNIITVQWPSATGLYRIIATKTYSGGGCTPSDTLLVNVLTTGLNELTSLGYVNLYPNPTKTDLNISLNSLKTQNIGIKIYDILGKACMSDLITDANGQINLRYSLSNLHGGIYLVEISTKEGKIVSKLLIE